MVSAARLRDGRTVPHPRVLIAEDDDSLRRLLARRLADAGFRVDAVTDGEAALDALHAARPDVLLTDLEMPAMDGGALCRSVREDDQLREMPIVVFSGSEDPAVVARLRSLGRIAMVGKGEGFDSLVRALRRLLAETAPA